MSINTYINNTKPIIDRQLKKLVGKKIPKELKDAACYAIDGPGKRLRPLLTMAICKDLKVPAGKALAPACALEYIHLYSCIHDDLPAMDNDSLRRGRKTLHVAYPEWLAILTGDLFLTKAFKILADAPKINAEQKIRMIRQLSYNAGGENLIGGQTIDMQQDKSGFTWKKLKEMHNRKTGALLKTAIEFGCILANLKPDKTKILLEAAQILGLAYQIIDDILDETGKTAILGKKSGADRDLQKNTAVSLLGLKKAQKEAASLQKRALDLLKTPPFHLPLTLAMTEKLLQRDF